ncbi:MAG: polysaccharide biosynthesis/export family protein [Desulfatirhabdiaceae bacterium]
MKRILAIAFLVMVLMISTYPVAAAQDKTSAEAQDAASLFGPDYLIGPGDILNISVWKEESLTREVVVLPDGKITFPLIGQVQAAGKTVNDLKREITSKIIKYAPKEEVTLEVKKVNSMIIYIIGRVKSPGRVELNANVNVLQALSIAGGLNEFARRNQIKIFRNESGKTKILKFSYDDVIDGDHVEQNVMLIRGDVVVVP